jgi:hypothetical protein
MRYTEYAVTAYSAGEAMRELHVLLRWTSHEYDIIGAETISDSLDRSRWILTIVEHFVE